MDESDKVLALSRRLRSLVPQPRPSPQADIALTFPRSQRVLPALPISIAVGILFYFSTTRFLSPLTEFAALTAFVL